MPKMFGVEIVAKDGDVLLRQEVPFQNDDDVILLRPEQIPLIIQWLQAAAEEAKAQQAGGA